MSQISADIFSILQQNTKNIRNICIMAHVDHGKTTLTDFLLSSNGILSSKMAGKVRMMDNRPDEQEREITMKSSSIALAYKRQPLPIWQRPYSEYEGVPLAEDRRDNIFLVNVIDSPGHVDFSSEVASAVRVSDGALVLVDVVEGFSVQTHAVLHQAWLEGVRPCLVLNKMDRLVTELKLTPMEAYQHCYKIIEEVNAVVATFLTADAMMASYTHKDEVGVDIPVVISDQTLHEGSEVVESENKENSEKKEKNKDKEKKDKDKEKDKSKKSKVKDDKKKEKEKEDGKKKKGDDKKDRKDRKDKDKEKKDKKDRKEQSEEGVVDAAALEYQVDIDDSKQWVFDPSLGNVAFVSAWDSWGFSLSQFATKYHQDYSTDVATMQRWLWGSHYFDDRKGRVVTKNNKEGSLEPLFVELVLTPIWRMYELYSQEDVYSINDTLTAFGVSDLYQEPEHLVARDWKARMQGMFATWLPISEALLLMTIAKLPSPVEAQVKRMERLLPSLHDMVKDNIPLPGSLDVDPQSQTSQPDLISSDVMNGLVNPVINYSHDSSSVITLARGVQTCDRLCPETLVYVVKVVDMKTMSANTASLAQARNKMRSEYQRAGRGGMRVPVSRPERLPPTSTSTPPTSTPIPSTQSDPSPVTPDSFQSEIDRLNNTNNTETSTPNPSNPPSASVPTVVPEEEEPEGPRFMAIARIFSGTLKSTDSGTFTVFGPKYGDDDDTASHTASLQRSGLKFHLLMGRDCEEMKEAPAGTVVGITGIDDIMYKFFSLSSVPDTPVFRPLTFQATPIVEVVVENVSVRDTQVFVEALKTLDKIDPNVTIGVNDQGEYYIAASGELHIERCIRDLHDTLCPGVELKVHPPSVAFRETIVSDFSLAQNNTTQIEAMQSLYEKSGGVGMVNLHDDGKVIKLKHGSWIRNHVARVQITSKSVQLRMRSIPLPEPVTNFLELNSNLLRDLRGKTTTSKTEFRKYLEAVLTGDEETAAASSKRTSLSPTEDAFFTQLRDIFVKATYSDSDLSLLDKVDDKVNMKVALDPTHPLASVKDLFTSGNIVDYIMAFGGNKGYGSNILINKAPLYSIFSSLTSVFGANRQYSHILDALYEADLSGLLSLHTNELGLALAFMKQLESGINQGYQYATYSGPMCQEPMQGVCYIIDQVSFETEFESSSLIIPNIINNQLRFGPLITQVRTLVHDTCHALFETHPRRLREAFFSVDLQCVADMIGRLVGVVNRRRGRVISDGDMVEGTQFFNIKALLPVQSSFGFVGDVRKHTSGVSNPVLYMSHWETIPIDPFFIPKTDLELEEFGTEDLSYNLAKKLITSVRERKGLMVDNVVVAAPEKQRTLARKK